MKKILVCDYTLRELTERRVHALLFREKMSIVKVIDALGIDEIELPPVKNQREDSVVFKTIAGTVKNPTLVLPLPEDPAEYGSLVAPIASVKNLRLKISLPVSTVQMEYSYRLKNAGMLEKIASLCGAAAALCPNVEFEARDATRAEPAFLAAAVSAAVDSGAKTVTLTDESGETTPEEFEKMVLSVKETVPDGVGIFVLTNDRLGLACACMLFALRAGADGVKTCLEGEGALTTEKAASILFSLGQSEGYETSLDPGALHTDIRTLLRGINKSGYTKDPEAEASLILDAESSPAQIFDAAASLGYDLSDEDVGKVGQSLRTICRKKGPVGKKEFEAIVASSAMQVPSTYHLDCYTATCGNTTLSVAQVTLIRGEEKISGVASGDGPIDAAFRALEGCVGSHYELDDFQIQSITEGKEALGSALVRLRHEGKLFSGSGLSTDIVGASIRAYVNALNKIVYEG